MSFYFSACPSRCFQDLVFRVSLEKGTKKEAPKRSMLDVVEGAMLLDAGSCPNKFLEDVKSG